MMNSTTYNILSYSIKFYYFVLGMLVDDVASSSSANVTIVSTISNVTSATLLSKYSINLDWEIALQQSHYRGI